MPFFAAGMVRRFLQHYKYLEACGIPSAYEKLFYFIQRVKFVTVFYYGASIHVTPASKTSFMTLIFTTAIKMLLQID
jgi:hypothetical protein